MNQYTPGSWLACGQYIVTDNDADEIYIAEVIGSDDEGKFEDDYEVQFANAHLLAAAPDLLEALQLTIADLQLISDENGGSHGRTLGRALAAIAKAVQS